jgi:hypothetical protein
MIMHVTKTKRVTLKFIQKDGLSKKRLLYCEVFIHLILVYDLAYYNYITMILYSVHCCAL